jgi:hypothetical protein
MSASKIHALLSELYRLLSDYRSGDFMSASQYKGTPPNFKDALRALARESGRQPYEMSEELRSSNAARRNRRIDQQQDAEKTIRTAILQSARFKTARSIADCAKELGLKTVVRPKDSRGRLARRLAQAIAVQAEPRRSEILASLGRGDDQIQGWINVIKSARP